MIVKVVDKSTDTQAKDWYFDSLYRVSFVAVVGFPSEGCDVRITDLYNEDFERNATFLVISGYKNNYPFVIVTDQETYLMNDEGKTLAAYRV